MIQKSLVLIFLTFIYTYSNAQSQEIWLQYKTKYPDHPAIYVEKSEELNIDLQADTLLVFSNNYEDLVHLNEESNFIRNEKVYGSSLVRVSDIEAKTLVQEKSKVKTCKVTDFLKKEESMDGVFYDDSYFYEFTYPSLQPKARTQLSYKETYVDPRLIGGFNFTTFLPVEKSIYKVKVNKLVEIKFRIFNDEEGKIKYSRSENGKYITHSWIFENAPKLQIEDGAPNPRYFMPHIVTYISSYTTSKGTTKVLSGTDDLFKWYSGFTRDINKQVSDELRTIVKEVTKEAKTEEEKVKKIFYWVQDHVRYIAFEDGMRGFIPHSGSYVCEKRYGDCKDMANIIVNMLDIAGIKGYYTWIGTRDIPYRYSEVSCPMVDNHMIASYLKTDGKAVFLDATSNYTRFGLPSSMIQGKEALIAISDTEYKIKEVPVIPKEINHLKDSFSISFDQNSLRGEGKMTIPGYPKVINTYYLIRSKQEDSKKHVHKLLTRGSNKFFVDDYSVKNLEDKDKPIELTYRFRVEDYVKSAGDEIYINLNLDKPFQNDIIDEKRKVPRERDYHYQSSQYLSFNIPEGYKVDYLPKDRNENKGTFGYSISYTVENDKIILKKTYFMSYLLLPKTEFKKWNEMVSSLNSAYKEVVILKKQ